jgi:hypothetical protein
VTNSFDADIAHHIIQKHESAVPTTPLLNMKKKYVKIIEKLYFKLFLLTELL